MSRTRNQQNPLTLCADALLPPSMMLQLDPSPLLLMLLLPLRCCWEAEAIPADPRLPSSRLEAGFVSAVPLLKTLRDPAAPELWTLMLGLGCWDEAAETACFSSPSEAAVPGQDALIRIWLISMLCSISTSCSSFTVWPSADKLASTAARSTPCRAPEALRDARRDMAQ